MSDPVPSAPVEPGGLRRHFGLLHATALNVTMVVGAGIFLTIPMMLAKLPGPYALLGWLGAGALMLVDGLVWSELGAMLPGSGGTYVYLLESYGRDRWGRLMAFLFIWQFLISGPLEIASGLIAIAQFSTALSPAFETFDKDQTWRAVLGQWQDKDLAISIGPARVAAILIGVAIVALLYRRITSLGKLTVTFWLGVLAVIAWILLEGGPRFETGVALNYTGTAATLPEDFWRKLGQAMILAMYSYLGYYNICYIGDEVRDPGRTIPRAILLSTVLVCVLFVGLHLAMLGTVPWQEVPPDMNNLPAAFMERIHGAESLAVVLVTLLLIWSCFGSAFAGLLGYSRIPYGAARYGHFFPALGAVHPRHHIPHVSLLVVSGLTLFWSIFDLESVIFALLATRILEQFIGQIVGLVLLRRREPNRPRPYRLWFYPVPCGLALAGWLYLYWSAGLPFMLLGLVTLSLGAGAFLLWSWRTAGWPFAAPPQPVLDVGRTESANEIVP
ncbi:MAG TPA: APC family permease [Gemmataceae bacterium]|nr:APC family permease [Gemmataceae bacterium]